MRTVDGAEGVSGGLATPDAFRAADIHPLAGRLIEPADLGKDWRRVVVLGNATWRTRFGSRLDVIGQRITLDDQPHTIIGVLPAGAVLPRLEDVQMWRPLHFDPRDEERRDWRGFLAIGRVSDGATLEQARREVARIAADLQRDHFPTRTGWTLAVERWQDVIVGPVRNAMFIFLRAVAFLLLIGCANVANLLLARSTARQRELALWPGVDRALYNDGSRGVAGVGSGPDGPERPLRYRCLSLNCSATQSGVGCFSPGSRLRRRSHTHCGAPTSSSSPGEVRLKTR